MSVSLASQIPYPTWNQHSAPECVAYAWAGLVALKRKLLDLPVFEPSRSFHYHNCLVADATQSVREAVYRGQKTHLNSIGTHAATGATVCRSQGICAEEYWPSSHGPDDIPPIGAVFNGLQHRITGAVPITAKRGPDGNYLLDDFRALLDARDPFLLSFILWDDGHLHVDGGNSLLVQEPVVWRGQTNHCVLVVGYDDAHKSEKGDVGALLCHNSYPVNGKWDLWIPYRLAVMPMVCFDGWRCEGFVG